MIYLGNNTTYKSGGGRCDECGRTSPTLATIAYDDGNGYGGEYCKTHSLYPSRIEIGVETVIEVMALWNRAESAARSALTFDEYREKVREEIQATRERAVASCLAEIRAAHVACEKAISDEKVA